jgi:hypothetical protein
MHPESTLPGAGRQAPHNGAPHTLLDLLVDQLRDLAATADRLAGQLANDRRRDLRRQLQNVWMLRRARRWLGAVGESLEAIGKMPQKQGE